MGIAEVRDKWLCLRVLCLKSQIPIFNDQNFQGVTLFGFLNFGHWKLFDICDLIF